MTAQLPDGVPGPVAHGSSEEVAASWATTIDEWVTVLEFAPADAARSVLVEEVEELVGHLSDWHAVGLWCRDRYAIQLQLPARAAHQALEWALAYYRQAAQAAHHPVAVLVRVEVSTAEELKRSCLEGYGTGTKVTAPAPQSVLSKDVYTATRSLITAATTADVAETLSAFVIAVGGRVEPGAAGDLPGSVAIDLGIEDGPVCHARAEAFSVAGLIIEQTLPKLLSDARQVATRLNEGHPDRCRPSATNAPNQMQGAADRIAAASKAPGPG